MTGVATLERPRAAAPSAVVATMAPRVDAASVSVLLLGTFAAAAFALGLATTLVSAFSWRTAMLGGALPYAQSGPDTLAWLCVAGALVAASVVLARHGSGTAVGVRVAAVGAAASVAAPATGLWAQSLRGTGLSHGSLTLIDDLTKAGYGLAAAGILALGAGALLARAATRGPWRTTLALVGAGLVIAALNPAYELVTLLTSAARTETVAEALTYGASLLGWLFIAGGILAATAALRSDRRTTCLAGVVPVATGGAVLVALSSATSLAWQELTLHATSSDWQTRLNEAAPTLAWVGWLGLAVALGTCAVRLARSV